MESATVQRISKWRKAFVLCFAVSFCTPAYAALSAIDEADLACEILAHFQGSGAIPHLMRAVKLEPSNLKYRAMRAQAFAWAMKPQDALADLNYILAKDPHNMRARRLRASVYFSLGRMQDGLNDTDQILKSEPRDVGTLFKRAQAYNAWHMHAKFKTDQAKLVELNYPPSVIETLERARKLKEQGKYEDALTVLVEENFRTPKNAEICYQLGWLYDEMQKNDRCVSAYSKAVSLSPPQSSIWRFAIEGRAASKAKEFKFKEALADVLAENTNLESTPSISYVTLPDWDAANYNKPFLMQARFYAAFGQYDKAIAAVSEPITKHIGPQHEPHVMRAGYYIAKKNFKQAIADYDELIRVNPSDWDARVKRCNLLTDLKDYKRALSDANALVAAESDDEERYFERGRLYVLLGDYSQAIADLSKAIQMDPEHDATRYYAMRATAYRKAGKIDLALADEKHIASFKGAKKQAKPDKSDGLLDLMK